ncbi:glycosyltransferase [Staphylococcus capitis]
MIDNSQANSYIKLKGHVNLAEVYKQYELYLSGSTSEGFGLTLMEAVGSGLGIIGFDVYYGNTTFINNHINGFKVPIDTVNIDENNLVTELANKILLFFTQNKEKLVDGLIFPSNLYIWCSMNSADQGVLPLDTAFKRRWDFEYFSVDDSFDEELFDTFGKIIVGKGKKVKWNDMRVFLNDKLSNFNVPEDKLMGPFFLSKNILNSDDSEVTKAFKNKVLMYLFEDIGTQYRSKIFNISKLRFSIIRDEFDRIGEKIFNGSDEIQTNIINVDEIDNDQKSSEQDGLGS